MSGSDSYYERECGGVWELRVLADERRHRWPDALKKVPVMGKGFERSCF